MKNLFNLNNPFMRMLARVADFVFLQMCFVICSLSVFTLGASITAMAKVAQTIIRDEDDAVVRPYLRAFKENFRQAVPAGLVGVLMIAGIISDFLLMKTFVEGTAYTVLLAVLFLFLFVVLGVLGWIFPLMARYQNTVRQHLQNAMILFVTEMPRTVGIVLVEIFPLILAWFFPSVLVYTLLFWALGGLSFSAYLIAYIQKKVFDKLDT